jgi:lytic murein transglycosylase
MALRPPLTLLLPLLSAALLLAPPHEVRAAALEKCFASVRAEAVKAGIRPSLVEKALGDVTFDEKAVRFSRTQPETKTPVWEYLTFLVDAPRIAQGKAMLDRHATLLKRIDEKYGVDPYSLVALWGIESDYGGEKGEFFLPHALANVACARKNGAPFRRELIAALRLVQKGDLDLDELQGSWAGAFGQTQFIPSTYARVAVDHDGDGRRDLIRSTPDALASAANYLKKAGWRDGVPWGFEVKLPSNYAGPKGRKAKAPLDAWKKRGITLASGKPLSDGGAYGLILPAGKAGPAFLVSRNFDAFYAYNASEAYALAIGHLSDRLRGKGGFAKPWPTDDLGLTRAQRKELQQMLADKGFYKGPVDGRVGPITNAAIKAAEEKAGMKPSGRPSQRIYTWLKSN